jgi:molybdopterin/thiamine biosynthesis adenylyltransferase
MSTESTWPVKTYQSYKIKDGNVADRQDRVPGFSTAKLQSKKILIIGAGGLGGAIAIPLARKGIGELRICDTDLVKIDNLNRQEFFIEDLHRFKAFCLAKNCKSVSLLGTVCVGHYVEFDNESADILADGIDIAIVGVDNNMTRLLASRYFREKNIPAIFTAVNESANFGYVFIQAPDGPCLVCVQPYIADAEKEPRRCLPSPAVIDILRIMGGLVTYTVDSLVMARDRVWNFRTVDLIGAVPDVVVQAECNLKCRVCADRNE